MANEVMVPLEQIGLMAKAVNDSGLFGIKSEAAAFSLMCIAQADGIPPIKAAVQYHIIDGKPALKSEAMLARFQAAGGKIRWKERNPNRCTLWLEHPNAGELEVTWDIERAQAAGLAGRNTWKAYPAQMMSARCISEGIRALYPACVGGFYTPEEVRDFDAPPPAPQPESPKPAQAAKAAEKAAERAQVKREPEQVKPAPKPAVKASEPIEAEIVKQEPAQSKAAEVTPEQATSNFLSVVAKICKMGAPFASQALTAMGVGDLQAIPAGDRHALVNDLKKRIADLQAKQKEIEDVPF